jgi:magnesium transporter
MDPAERKTAGTRFDTILDSVRRLLRRGAITHLERMVNKMHPADVANVLHHLHTPQEKRTVFELFKVEGNKSQVLSDMDEGDVT